MPRSKSLLPAALVAAFLSVGCAGTSHTIDVEAATHSDVVAKSRDTIDELRKSRFAAEAKREIDRAERWLAEVQRRLEDDDDDERSRLTMTAVHTQLAAVKAFYLRREAQQALEGARDGYSKQRERTRSLESENRKLQQ